MINQTLEEQEMTINVYPRNILPVAEVYTSIPHWAKRLEKLAASRPEEVTLRETDGGLFATVPLDWVKIKPPKASNLTEEERRLRAEHLRAVRPDSSREAQA